MSPKKSDEKDAQQKPTEVNLPQHLRISKIIVNEGTNHVVVECTKCKGLINFPQNASGALRLESFIESHDKCASDKCLHMRLVAGRNECLDCGVIVEPVDAPSSRDCDHANENPSVCPCRRECYCRTRGSCVNKEKVWFDGDSIFESIPPHISTVKLQNGNNDVKCEICGHTYLAYAARVTNHKSINEWIAYHRKADHVDGYEDKRDDDLVRDLSNAESIINKEIHFIRNTLNQPIRNLPSSISEILSASGRLTEAAQIVGKAIVMLQRRNKE